MKSKPGNIFRCPFCGGEIKLPRQRFAVVGCQCCAFPIVDGIACFVTGDAAKRAIKAIEAGKNDAALAAMLAASPSTKHGLKTRATAKRFTPKRGTGFQPVFPMSRLQSVKTFREALQLLIPGPEADYLFYRFSDPTLLRTRTILRAVLQSPTTSRRFILDLCGGTGHLSRFMSDFGDVVLLDKSFAKLWLAKRFIAPNCTAVCADAEQPLPFAATSFDIAACSDAFHYIWHKRLLADELQKTITRDGVVVMGHLHNSRSWNYSQGMPLDAMGYRALFSDLHASILAEANLPFDLPGNHSVDLTARRVDADVPAFSLLATRNRRVLRKHELRVPQPRSQAMNPLYSSQGNGDGWHLNFPSVDYQEEYAACREYLPATVASHPRAEQSRELAARGAILDLPKEYV